MEATGPLKGPNRAENTHCLALSRTASLLVLELACLYVLFCFVFCFVLSFHLHAAVFLVEVF